MANVSFSLTEKFVINPVLSMRASLLIDPNNPPSMGSRLLHHFNAEITARVIAASTSIFAAADCAIHATTGIYKGGYLLLRKMNCTFLKPASFNSQEVKTHFTQAGKFALLTAIGSIAGAVWPDVLKYFILAPSSPDDDNGASLTNAPDDDNEASWANAPEELLQLVEAVKNGEEKASFQNLRNYWAKASLENKHWFVKIFSGKYSSFVKVRLELGDMVYRHIDNHLNDPRSLSERKVQWISGYEIDMHISRIWKNTSQASNRGFFFHATSERNLEGILKSKKIEVRHEKMYRGAFVSTVPETGFGPCVLVFKRNIERLSRLEHGFTINHKTYWAGFSRDIPVTPETLAYIILDNPEQGNKQALEANCEAWAGRKIEVITHDDARQKLHEIEKLDMGIPIEWPDEGERVGGPILRHMKLALALQPVVQHQVSIVTCLSNRISLLREHIHGLRYIIHSRVLRIKEAVAVPFVQRRVVIGQSRETVLQQPQLAMAYQY